MAGKYRVKSTTTVWYYRVSDSSPWEKFPTSSIDVLERGFNTRAEGNPEELLIYSKFLPFVKEVFNTNIKSEPTVRSPPKDITIIVNFKTQKLLVTKSKKEVSIQRKIEFEVPLQRAKYDKECGVQSLPIFANPFYDADYQVGETPFTVKEKSIIELSANIREKTDWETKYKDTKIITKWKKEFLAQDGTEDVFEYVIKELDYYASIQSGAMKPSGVPGVWQADKQVPEELRQALLQQVAKLENVPEKEKDYHPGSNNQVLDLVHPSLFCLVGGVSLECDPGHPPFSFIGGGKRVRDNLALTSEILDLKKQADDLLAKLKEDTKGTPLYYEIMKLEDNNQDSNNNENNEYNNNSPKITRIEAMEVMQLIREKRAEYIAQSPNINNHNRSSKYQWLPSDFRVDNNGKVSILSYINNLEPRSHEELYKILAKILETFIPMFERVLTDLDNPRERRYNPDPYSWYKEPEDMSDSEYEAYYDNRTPELPPLLPFSPPPSPHFTSLNGRRLQVIVKLANIILTPEKPEYQGGVWHVEGMQNEQIVSSGIYYYHSENITESRLHFRVAIANPNYEQNDDTGIRLVYGLENDEPLNQKIGSVVTQSGRSIAFPNLYQHWVAPFKLQDPTKEGVRKILVFFLVDPATYITSTCNVPPQQPLWRRDTINKYKPMNTLAPHIQDAIFNYAATMTLDDAKKYREELMRERKFFVKQNSTFVFEREFSLCEH